MQLQEIMSTRVASACPEDDLEAAQERMRPNRHPSSRSRRPA